MLLFSMAWMLAPGAHPTNGTAGRFLKAVGGTTFLRNNSSVLTACSRVPALWGSARPSVLLSLESTDS